MNKLSIPLSLAILTTLMYNSFVMAGYAAIVKNLTPFELKVTAHGVGALKAKEVTILPGQTGESKTGGADLLDGVDVKANIPDRGEVSVYSDRWLGQAKAKDSTIYIVADVSKETTVVPARGGTVGGTMTTYNLKSLSIHGKRGDLEKAKEGAVITIK